MKKAYKSPVVKKIDFVYDEQVVAESQPAYNLFGDPGELTQRCRFSIAECTYYYWDTQMCTTNVFPMSLR